MSSDDVLFWGPEGKEFTSATDPDEAVQDELDNCDPPFPATLTLHGRKLRHFELKPGDIVDPLIERLWEKFQSYEADPFEPTERIKEAEQALIEAMNADYYATVFEDGPPVESMTVNVTEWVTENCPDWLTENPELVAAP